VGDAPECAVSPLGHVAIIGAVLEAMPRREVGPLDLPE